MVETKETDSLTGEKHPNNGKGQDKDLNKINSLKSDDKHDIIAHYTKENDTSPIERVKFEGLGDNDSICSEESDDEELPPIPDGGWGWVVVASAFLVSACADGLAFSFGLLQEEFKSYFDASQAKTSLIGSLFIAMPLLVGPIMSTLVDRYGCRIMTMVAGVVSTIGFLLAFVSNSIEMLCVTFGFISGLAMGVLYVTAVVSVAFWFDKRRNLAVSLASCGIGFGTLVYPPLIEYLLYEFGWRNTILLLAGTLFNMCVCGALMRTPDWLEIKQKRERRLSKATSRRTSSAGSVGSRSLGGESVFLTADELKALLQSGKSPDYILETLTTSIAEAQELEATTQMNAEQSYKRMHSAIHLPTFIQQHEKVPSEVIEKLMENKRLYNIILRNYPELVTRRRSDVNLHVDGPPADAVIEPAELSVEIKVKNPKDKTDKDKSEKIAKDDKEKPQKVAKDDKDKKDTRKSEERDKADPNTNKSHDKHRHGTKEGKLPTQASWIRQISTTDHHYLRDMPLYRTTMMHRSAMMNIPRYKLRASSLPDMYKNSMWSFESIEEMTCCDRFKKTLKSTFDFKMFTEFHFLMFNLGSLILSIWFIVPYFFLTSYMSDSGLKEGGALMISIIGVASSIGIVGLGWAGDQPWLNVTKAYALCLIICGISVGAYPFFITNFWALTVVSAIFGLSFASSYAYTPMILMQLMPIDHFTMAYGLILLSQGIGHLVGPPIGGWLCDVTKTWDLTFYMGGIWLIISGVCVGVIAYTKDVRMCGNAPLLKEAEEAEKAEDATV